MAHDNQPNVELLVFSQVAVMRTKNRRQMRLAGEVPVEVALTRPSWEVMCEVWRVWDGCEGGNGRSYHCGGCHCCNVFFSRASWY